VWAGRAVDHCFTGTMKHHDWVQETPHQPLHFPENKQWVCHGCGTRIISVARPQVLEDDAVCYTARRVDTVTGDVVLEFFGKKSLPYIVTDCNLQGLHLLYFGLMATWVAKS
jgi:hypothetical protein